MTLADERLQIGTLVDFSLVSATLLFQANAHTIASPGGADAEARDRTGETLQPARGTPPRHRELGWLRWIANWGGCAAHPPPLGFAPL